MKYVLTGSRFNIKGSINAQEVGEFIEALPIRTPEAIWELAKEPSCPLHKHIEWNKDKAAYQYQLLQIRHLVCSIGIETDHGPTRAFESVVIDDDRQYEAVDVIADSPILMDQVIETALNEISFWRSKHQRLSKFFGGVFDEITKVEEAYRSKNHEKGKGRTDRKSKGRDKAKDTVNKKANRKRDDYRRLAVVGK